MRMGRAPACHRSCRDGDALFPGRRLLFDPSADLSSVKSRADPRRSPDREKRCLAEMRFWTLLRARPLNTCHSSNPKPISETQTETGTNERTP